MAYLYVVCKFHWLFFFGYFASTRCQRLKCNCHGTMPLHVDYYDYYYDYYDHDYFN